ncbi:protein E6-like [Malania oleifera]|uniref:protein E6-like n=1 Tax=Malania oleifera TaxID=397392 RepID=UPI0025AE0651|nr:protein E6-like [Malania oleifera]
MASSAKFFSFIFLLAVSSVQIHARESELFSKFGKSQQESQLPTRDASLNNRDDEPEFVPETSQNGYGLFGNEPGQLPPTTTTTTTSTPASYASAATYSTSKNSQLPKSGDTLYRYRDTPTTVTIPATATTTTAYSTSENSHKTKAGEPLYRYRDTAAAASAGVGGAGNYYNGVNRYESQKQGIGQTRLTGRQNSYWSSASTGGYNNGVNGYTNQQPQFQQQSQRQGMSDTRYIANGRFYYDVNADRSLDNNNRNYGIKNVYGNSRVATYRNGNGYNSNNQGFSNSYDNEFYHPNGRERYQTQMQIQEEDDEFVP